MRRPLPRNCHGAQQAGEIRAGAGFLCAGFQNVEDHSDSAGLARRSDLNIDTLNSAIFQDGVLELFTVDYERRSFKPRSRFKARIIDRMYRERQFHNTLPFRGRPGPLGKTFSHTLTHIKHRC